MERRRREAVHFFGELKEMEAEAVKAASKQALDMSAFFGQGLDILASFMIVSNQGGVRLENKRIDP